MPFDCANADAHRLERRFLGGEPDGKSLGRISSLLAVVALARGEETFDKARTPIEHPPKSVDINQIDADGVDHDRQRSARSFTGSVMRSITGTSTSRSSRNTGSVSVTACLMAP